MKKHCLYNIIRCNLLLAVLLGLASCNVHEWPEEENAYCVLKLEFTTVWDEEEHFYTRGTKTTTRALGEYDMRYIINAYPVDEEGNVSQIYTRQFVFSQAVFTEYDYETAEVALPAGRYKLMAWADFVTPGTTNNLYYLPTDFSAITYNGTHTANTDYRDAFRGSVEVELEADIQERIPEEIVIPMQRPLAKFTFVSNDLKEFIAKEETRVNRNNRNTKGDADTKDADTKEADTKDGETRTINLDDYQVLFIYSGYLPNVYNMFSDKPADVTQGVRFTSKLTQINDEEASMGFDYVMVNGSDAAVEVMVGLLDSEGTQISMSEPLIVPLRRSMHTIMRGSFLMTNATGGVGIDPGFDGDHNVIL